MFQLKKWTPDSAALHAARHSASKTRVNALMALRSIRGTSIAWLDRRGEIGIRAYVVSRTRCSALGAAPQSSGSAAHHAARHSASKTRVNALMALRSIRGTSVAWLDRQGEIGIRAHSQITSLGDLAHGHGRAPRFDIDIAIRQGLHPGDQGLAREVAFETTEFVSRDDDDFVASMDGHTLRSLAADTPHKFAETRLCVPQQPVAGVRIASAAAGSCLFHRRFWISGHADQYITVARGISMKPTAKSCPLSHKMAERTDCRRSIPGHAPLHLAA
jgi:hypothetical protein